MDPYIVKYDYEAAFGIGTLILFADDEDDCVKKFRKYMFDKIDDKWLEYTYHRSEFRHVSMNVFGWHTYWNDSANVCIKVRKIDKRFGELIPIYEHFEHDARSIK